jgi:hypothetical protein
MVTIIVSERAAGSEQATVMQQQLQLLLLLTVDAEKRPGEARGQARPGRGQA